MYRSLLILTCLCVPAWGQTAKISGPASIAPGDLVVLDSSESDGDSKSWVLANSNRTFLPVEGGKYCVFASSQPGEYVFVLAVSKADATRGSAVAIAKHVLVVGGPAPGPVPPQPVPPHPQPEPSVPLTGVALEIFNVTKSIAPPREEAVPMAAAFQKVLNNAARAAGLSQAYGLAEINRDVRAEVTAVVKTADMATRWKPFSVKFAELMKPQATPQSALQVFEQVVAGLSYYAKPVSAAEGDKPLLQILQELRSETDGTENQLRTLQQKIGQ